MIYCHKSLKLYENIKKIQCKPQNVTPQQILTGYIPELRLLPVVMQVLHSTH